MAPGNQGLPSVGASFPQIVTLLVAFGLFLEINSTIPAGKYCKELSGYKCNFILLLKLQVGSTLLSV